MKIKCPSCEWSTEVPDEKIPAGGGKGICPKCKTEIVVKKEQTLPPDFLIEPAKPEIDSSQQKSDTSCWKCASCNSENDPDTLRCTCGYEFGSTIPTPIKSSVNNSSDERVEDQTALKKRLKNKYKKESLSDNAEQTDTYINNNHHSHIPCPYCRELINPEAIKCKHCGSTFEELANVQSSESPLKSRLKKFAVCVVVGFIAGVFLNPVIGFIVGASMLPVMGFNKKNSVLFGREENY